MAPRPKWWHMLQESRRQACVGIDFYNRAGDERSYLDFVVHMHLAWQYLLQAECERQGQDYRYRDAKGRVQKTKDGDKKTWDLARCLTWRYPTDTDPARVNVEFFIGLRNKIEHRFQDSLMMATAGQAHAYVINYEAELVGTFGADHSLSEVLRFPVFVQNLSPGGVKEQLALRRKLPAGVQSFITSFETRLDKRVRESDRYDYRILLVPVKGPKSDADLAVSFIKAEELTEEKRAQMERDGKVGTALLVEKHRDVLHSDELAPADAVALIEPESPFEFRMWEFTQLVKHHKIKPSKGQAPEKTDRRFCLYDKPWKKYLYTQAFVKRCIEDVSTRERFKATVGREPRAKVTSLPDRGAVDTGDRSTA